MVNDKLPIKQTNQQKMQLFGLHGWSEVGNLSNKHNEMYLISLMVEKQIPSVKWKGFC